MIWRQFFLSFDKFTFQVLFTLHHKVRSAINYEINVHSTTISYHPFNSLLDPSTIFNSTSAEPLLEYSQVRYFQFIHWRISRKLTSGHFLFLTPCGTFMPVIFEHLQYTYRYFNFQKEMPLVTFSF